MDGNGESDNLDVVEPLLANTTPSPGLSTARGGRYPSRFTTPSLTLSTPSPTRDTRFGLDLGETTSDGETISWWGIPSRGSVQLHRPSLLLPPPPLGPRRLSLRGGLTLPIGTRRWGWLFRLLGMGMGTGLASEHEEGRDKEKEGLMVKGRKKSRRYRASRRDRVGRRSVLDKVLDHLSWGPWTILLLLMLFTGFVVSVTFTLIYILNPDKAPLPWRAYCSGPSPTFHALRPAHPARPPLEASTLGKRFSSRDLILKALDPIDEPWPYSNSTAQMDDLSPVGVFVGVMSKDSGLDRRNMIRQSYASHPRSRIPGTEGVKVMFILGRPRRKYARAVELEAELFGDMVILDVKENMNSGKTHTFFSWAAENATVPSVDYPLDKSFDDTHLAIGSMSDLSVVRAGERRPDWVMKADDDSFIMLGELERRLRVSPRSKAFWGYLVKNAFMAGEAYAMTIDLVDYIATSPVVRQMKKGKEDRVTSSWMKAHPEREKITWVSERCWIYDHPRAGTVYSHGFLFPDEVQRVAEQRDQDLINLVSAVQPKADSTSDNTTLGSGSSEMERELAKKDALSTVSKFGKSYRAPVPKLHLGESIEALIEGSAVSLVRPAGTRHGREFIGLTSSVPFLKSKSQAKALSKEERMREQVALAYSHRPSRSDRFRGSDAQVGGTVVVHYIKKREWFQETWYALLGVPGEDDTTIRPNTIER